MSIKVKPSVEEVRLALGKIMKLPSSVGFTGYAQSYANAALQMQMTDRALEVQLLYVLNNLQQWRGEEAREVKKLLKAYAGVK